MSENSSIANAQWTMNGAAIGLMTLGFAQLYSLVVPSFSVSHPAIVLMIALPAILGFFWDVSEGL